MYGEGTGRHWWDSAVWWVRFSCGVGHVRGGVSLAVSQNKVLFKMIERPGAIIGMRDPYEKDGFMPYVVVAIKQAPLSYSFGSP